MTNLAPHRNWSWPIRVGVATGALALVVLLGRVVVMTPSAEAHADATFTVLYSFKGLADGSFLYAGLVRDAAGNLYGTTIAGGTSGKGTVFKLDPTGTKTVLHSFTGPPLDGQYPEADLIRDAAGNLYGTTPYGGTSDAGRVFKVDTTGAESVLHSFTGTPDGSQPYAGLVQDAAGNFYGTTYGGGDLGKGMVFKLDTTGQVTVLHSFAGVPDGQFPNTKLVRDAAGNLYGTTEIGGDPKCNFANGCVMVFKLDATGTETVLHSFTESRADGGYPEGGLVRDASGTLYGTTYFGGASNLGTVFKLDNAGVETVLYSFTGGATDGAYPLAGLLQGATGTLYGTTNLGGASNLGTVFRVTASGTETMLRSLRGGSDGRNPRAGLVQDPAGNLYGTTSAGGPHNKGTVFKLSR
jgi:uncharacterized repeat protein (TIGR03803 family)